MSVNSNSNPLAPDQNKLDLIEDQFAFNNERLEDMILKKVKDAENNLSKDQRFSQLLDEAQNLISPVQRGVAQPSSTPGKSNNNAQKTKLSINGKSLFKKQMTAITSNNNFSSGVAGLIKKENSKLLHFTEKANGVISERNRFMLMKIP